MLEDSRTKERRRHPDGSKRRNFLEKDRRLRCDQCRWRSGMLILTRGDECDRALVFGRARIRVKTRVQLRRGRETQRQEKRSEQTTRDQGAEFFAATHNDGECVIMRTLAQGLFLMGGIVLKVPRNILPSRGPISHTYLMHKECLRLRVTWSSAALLFLFSTPAVLAQEAVSTAHGSSRDSPDATVQSVPPPRGIEFPVAITTEVLGNLAGGSSRHVIWESLFNVGLALDLEKVAGWKGGNISVRAIYPQGTGLTSIAVHDFNTLSNIDGYDSFRLYDAWFQQEFANGRLSLRIGQLLADAEFFDSDNAALFLNSSFGAIPLVSQNLNPPIFPTAAPGIRLLARPLDSFYVETAIFSGDTGNPTLNNKHNTRFSFRGRDGVLVFAEMGYEWNMKQKAESLATPGSSALAGSLKLSGYYDSKLFSDSGGALPHRGDYSVYAVLDQELWHPRGSKDRVLSFFSRAGGAPADRNTVTWYCDAGLNFKGLMASRAQDTLGFAFSHTELSHDLVNDSRRLFASHHEEVLELTYQAVCNSHLSIQPDLQVIINPGATMPASTAVVSGIRLNVQF